MSQHEFRSLGYFRRDDNFALGAQHGGVHNEEPGLDGAQLGKLIKEMSENSESRVFIRGTTLTALATIKRLTDRGIDAGRIIYGMDAKISSMFDVGKEDLQFHKQIKEADIDVGQTLLDQLKSDGVDVIEGVEKTEVKLLPTGQIDFVMVDGAHEYECDIFCDLSATRRVAHSVFKTLSDACLVYDGALGEDFSKMAIDSSNLTFACSR